MRYWTLLCCLLVSSRSLAQPNRSSARPEAFALDWKAPDGCPDAAFVRQSLERLLASGEPTARHLRADARVEQTAETEYTLRLRTDLDGVRGERILRGPLCASVSDAGVLTLALMLNPDTKVDYDAPTQSAIEATPGVAAAGSPRRTGDAAQAEAFQNASTATPTAASTEPAALRSQVTLLPDRRLELVAPERRRLRLGWQISGEIGLAAGVLPRIGPEAGLGIHATLGHAMLCLSTDFGPIQRQYVAEGSNLGGRLWTATLALYGCWTLRGRAWAAGPCVGSAITRLDGKGVGVLHPHDGIVYWVAPLVAAHFDLRVTGNFALRLVTMGLFPVDRPRVFLDDLGQLHRPSVVEARAQLATIFELH